MEYVLCHMVNGKENLINEKHCSTSIRIDDNKNGNQNQGHAQRKVRAPDFDIFQ